MASEFRLVLTSILDLRTSGSLKVRATFGGSTVTGGSPVTGGAGGSQAARITAAPRAPAAAAAVNTFRRLRGLELSFPDGGGGGTLVYSQIISLGTEVIQSLLLILSRFIDGYQSALLLPPLFIPLSARRGACTGFLLKLTQVHNKTDSLTNLFGYPGIRLTDDRGFHDIVYGHQRCRH